MMASKKNLLGIALFGLGLSGWSSVALADSYFVGSSGNLAASVQFNEVGGNLVVTLTNTATDAAEMVPNGVLTGVYFNIAGSPSLTPLSAIIPAGSSLVQFGSSPTDVGGEWAFK